MTNALTEQLMRALPEGDDPLQRLKQLAQEMGIERPTRRTKRAFLRVAHRLGIECPAETHGSPAPMLDLPPAAEFVVRGREKAWRQTREEQLARAANRLQHSKVGLKVALAAKDQAAAARALRALAGFEIKPDDVRRCRGNQASYDEPARVALPGRQVSGAAPRRDMGCARVAHHRRLPHPTGSHAGRSGRGRSVGPDRSLAGPADGRGGSASPRLRGRAAPGEPRGGDRKSTRLNSSHTVISYAVFCLKKKKTRLGELRT